MPTTALAAIAAFFIVVFGYVFVFSGMCLPPILKHVSAGGDPYYCYASQNNGDEYSSSEPDLTFRLNKRFPPGSDAERLVEYLKQQHFALDKRPCEDSFVGAAWYNGLGSSVLLTASASWKSDLRGRILWVKGQVSYNGL